MRGIHMKIVLAPDSFKGSITALELCAAMKRGIISVFPVAEVIELPLADGGEGTLAALVHATKGVTHRCIATDPLGRRIEACYGVLGDQHTVIIEVAEASGLPLLQEHERNPMLASSYGTGELIVRALEVGYRSFLIGLGGSATNDAGVGIIRALGGKFLDHKGDIVPDGPQYIAQIASIDMSELHPAIYESTFHILTDVNNPLCGPDGASAVFGPQKGATASMVAELEQSLLHYGTILSEYTKRDMLSYAGGGAAGGIATSLMAFLGATRGDGIRFLLEKMNATSAFATADLIITGEGKLDSQTLSGKVIAGVSELAKTYLKPVIALCGSVQLSNEQMKELGLAAAFSITKGPASLEEAMLHTAEWTEWQLQQIMNVYAMLSANS